MTIALLATRKIDSQTAGIYIVAQLVGADHRRRPDLHHPDRQRPGEARPRRRRRSTPNAGVAIGVAAETIGTAILVFTVFGAAVDGRAPGGFAGIIIGFIVYGIIILVGPITGAALNPARQIGPELLGGLIGATTQRRSARAGLHRRPDRRRPGRRVPLRVHRPHRTATVPGAAVAEAAHADA